jgi:hypothetical protein
MQGWRWRGEESEKAWLRDFPLSFEALNAESTEPTARALKPSRSFIPIPKDLSFGVSAVLGDPVVLFAPSGLKRIEA